MALISVARYYTYTSNGSFGAQASYTGLDFDTDSHSIVRANGSFILALLDPRPADYVAAVGAYLWMECAPDFTQTKWFYAGGNNVTSTTIANSAECGWLPPTQPAATCDLVLVATVSGDRITATASGVHGNLSFSIDGGLSRQASGEFIDLAPRAYVVMAFDTGAPNCSRSQTVFVTAAPPGLTPVPSALPDVAFAGNPIALVGQATRPGRALLLELFVETAHGSLDYRRLVQRLRPTDAAGRTVLELQRELAAALTADRPDLRRAAGPRRLRTSIRRYYAALAEIIPATGQPGPFVFAQPRTVLLGGLSWQAARENSFFPAAAGKWMTWRPELVQDVGPDHVLLQTALLPATVLACTAEVRCYQRGETAAFQILTYPLVLAEPTSSTPAGSSAGASEGGTSTSTTTNSLNPPTPYLVELQVPVSALPAGTYRATVRFLDERGLPLTRARLFRLDADSRRRQFLFLNSLGCFDAVSCYGPRSSKTSVERTVATQLQAPDYDPESGPSSVAALTADDRITVSTGMVSPQELYWLRELHTSREVYEVVGGKLRKLLLTTKDFITAQDDAGGDGYVFEYQYAFDPTPFAL